MPMPPGQPLPCAVARITVKPGWQRRWPTKTSPPKFASAGLVDRYGDEVESCGQMISALHTRVQQCHVLVTTAASRQRKS